VANTEKQSAPGIVAALHHQPVSHFVPIGLALLGDHGDQGNALRALAELVEEVAQFAVCVEICGIRDGDFFLG